MEKENKLLLGATIILIGLIIISMNFGITGSSIRISEESEIEVKPSIVFNGENINILVRPSTKGVNNKANFYIEEDNLRKTSIEICNNYICSKETSINFNIPNGWEQGVYSVRVYDYGKKEFIKKEFTVRNK